MRRVLLVALSGVLLSAFMSGCVLTSTPLAGTVITQLKAPVMIGDNTAGHSKVGRAKASGILGFVLDGDCSIQAAMASQGITKIHHVDTEVNSILGIYAEYTTVVYGD